MWGVGVFMKVAGIFRCKDGREFSSFRVHSAKMLLENAGAHESRSKRLDKVSAPGNSVNVGATPDDIPVALRETPMVAAKQTVSKPMFYSGLAALALVGLGAGGFVALQIQRSQPAPVLATNSAQSIGTPSPQPSPTASPASSRDTLLNHFRYQEAPQSELVPIVSDGSMKMRQTAASAYQKMEAAAQQEGVSLVPISAFRSIADQNYLFFDKKAERGQDAAERAKVSAPPGYSEHHTGYAIDIGDGNVPATNLSPTFEDTPAYKWLKANAAFYSFENSFPKNNKQGVSYEPWHWRFVGDTQSLETFYKARQNK